MFGLEKLKGNQAASLGLLSAGAAMLDPRGTGGNTGAAFNKGVSAGLNTYVPMMQWQQNKKDRKEDRDWSKQQDMIRNVLQERQFKMRKEAFEGEAENREARTNIARAQFGLMEQKMQNELSMMEAQNKAMSNLWNAKTQGMPTPGYKDQAPPMAINPATNQPFGNQKRLSQFTPASQEQLNALGGAALAAGGNKDAVEMLTQGSGGLMNPYSSQFKSSNFNAANNMAEAQRLVDAGIAKDLDEGIFIARTRLSPDAVDDRQWQSGGGNPLANIK